MGFLLRDDPAFALVIKFEMFRETSLTPTPAQDAFFKAIQDKLYEVYRQNHNCKYGTIPARARGVRVVDLRTERHTQDLWRR